MAEEIATVYEFNRKGGGEGTGALLKKYSLWLLFSLFLFASMQEMHFWCQQSLGNRKDEIAELFSEPVFSPESRNRKVTPEKYMQEM